MGVASLSAVQSTRGEAHGDSSVDVIIPTRNRPALTLEAIESVRRQTFQNWHLYVVDDASDDDTAEQVANAARHDDRIVVVRRTRQGGSNAARQTGFEHASAALVAILDSDDLWVPHKLETQLARWNEERRLGRHLGVVVCRHAYTDLDGRRLFGPLPPRRSSRLWTPFTIYNTSTPLMSRAALERAGGFHPPGHPRFCTTDHIDLYLRLTRQHPVAVVPEVLVRCRHHTGERNSDHQGTAAAAQEAACLLQLHGDVLAADRRQRAWLRGCVGGRYLAAGYFAEGVKQLRPFTSKR